jgi:hypothetical protein
MRRWRFTVPVWSCLTPARNRVRSRPATGLSGNKHTLLEEQLKRSPRIREHRRQKDRIRERTATNLGGDQPYRQVFNPFDSDEVPVVATLSDDLSDIYCDVEKGLLSCASIT